MTKDTMLEVTSYEVLGQLPDIFTFDSNTITVFKIKYYIL